MGCSFARVIASLRMKSKNDTKTSQQRHSEHQQKQKNQTRVRTIPLTTSSLHSSAPPPLCRASSYLQPACHMLDDQLNYSLQVSRHLPASAARSLSAPVAPQTSPLPHRLATCKRRKDGLDVIAKVPSIFLATQAHQRHDSLSSLDLVKSPSRVLSQRV